MRVGVVGLGSIGRRHVANLLALGHEVCGYELSEETAGLVRAEFPAVCLRCDGGFESLDAIVIATPAENHLPWVELAINKRKPFLVEKPLGTLEQLPRWREIAQMDLPVNQVGYMLRHCAIAQAMKAFRPTLSRITLIWDGSKYEHGLLESSHEIDLALWLGAGEVLDAASDGKGVFLHLAPSHVLTLRWKGSTYVREWIAENAEYRCEAHLEPDDFNSAYRAELEHFLSCVQSGTPTICPLADGLKALEVCAEVERMAKVGA